VTKSTSGSFLKYENCEKLMKVRDKEKSTKHLDEWEVGLSVSDVIFVLLRYPATKTISSSFLKCENGEKWQIV
jgi:hypothetical protein